MHESTVPAQAPDEVDILHQRKLTVPAQLVKDRPAYKQSLVTIGQVE
jgi:hypothetical protein